MLFHTRPREQPTLKGWHR